MNTASTLLAQRRGRRQAGFLLPTMAIVIVLFVLIAGLILQRYAEEHASAMGDERAALVGARLAAFDDAAKTYVTTFFTQIQRQQQAQRNGYAVPAARVQAPTAADLVGLGMLRSEDATEFVYNGRAIGFTVQLAVPSTGCTIPNCNVQSLVVSTQPMVELRDQSVVDVRRASIAAAAASPGRAGVSLPESPTAFVSKDGAHVAMNTSGAAGLIGIKNGYDSSGFLEFARRDGSLPMTGDINMLDDSGARHGIRNASDVATQTVTAAGRVKTGEFLDLDGPIQVEGTPCEKRGLAASDAGGLLLSCQSGIWRKAQGSGGTGIQGAMAPFRGMTASCGYIYASVDMSGNYRIYRNGGLQCTNRTPCIADMGETITFNGIGIEVRIPGSGGGGDGETSLDICRAYFPAS